MNKTNPRIMPGFMELLPENQILFNSLIDMIRETYESFGYLPLDTHAGNRYNNYDYALSLFR